ncbi:conserved membrane hypothetical protein [Vibrio chagasii]|nr:conserved membrane hypothetical protein [Vibrio chagasii]CAH7145992.1 conserved membrane hypothetical protein [Vibrio chagasii]CAH7151676.1 conserved membrane hypothetical protein [Vibrio chagasii]
MKLRKHKQAIRFTIILLISSYPILYFPIGSYRTDKIYLLSILLTPAFFWFFLISIVQLKLIFKTKKDHIRMKDKTSYVLLAISFMLSFLYYLKMEDYKTNSPTHVYCCPELEAKRSRGIFEKFAITEELCNE